MSAHRQKKKKKRLGQWSSPHLTTISKRYCGDEFLLDTPHLLEKVEEYNQSPQEGNILLATLDVEALYPSINPTLALEAMADAFTLDSTTSDGIKEALMSFTKLSFQNSCVTFRDHCYNLRRASQRVDVTLDKLPTYFFIG